MARQDTHDGTGTEYAWDSDAAPESHLYLTPRILQVLGEPAGRRVLDLGCGNGSLTSELSSSGFDVVGVDSASSGLDQAVSAFGELDFRAHDINEPLPEDLRGKFDVVVAVEVIEHLFLPRRLFERSVEALQPGGDLIITTPYHGYLKNLALACTNSFDHHWRPSWDYGHVKFFSVRSLREMCEECGFSVEAVHRVGRIPSLAKSMILRTRWVGSRGQADQ